MISQTPLLRLKRKTKKKICSVLSKNGHVRGNQGLQEVSLRLAGCDMFVVPHTR